MSERSSDNRIYAFDAIRVFATAGIVIYHLMLLWPDDRISAVPGMLPYNPGHVLVVLFFMLSGAVLYYRDPDLSKAGSLKQYFVRRWRRIFPRFYLCYLICFIIAAAEAGKLFFRGDPLKLIWTVLGLDGYVYYRFPNYYLIGEWFLGALIILYLVYPLLLSAIRKFDWIAIAVAAVLLAVSSRLGSFGMDPFRDPFCCMVSFLLGMWFMKHRLFEERKLLIPSIAAAVLLFIIPMPHILRNITLHLFSASLFVILFNAGVPLTDRPGSRKLFSALSNASYTVFLVHHFLLIRVISLLSR